MIRCRIGAAIAGLVIWQAAAAAADSGSGELARNAVPGPVPVEVIRIIDGDTIVVRVHPWLGVFIETHVRLEGIDAPELHGRCEQETAMAARARERLTALLADGQASLQNVRNDKYGGRVRARVYSGAGTDVAEVMVAAGLARRYHGERRAPWCLGAG